MKPDVSGCKNDLNSDPMDGIGLPPLWEHCIDDYRPIKITVIGAGLSGILAGIRFSQQIPNLDLTIYDKNEEVGGTWWENRYPGVRCDIPSAAYQYTFESNPEWPEYYSEGAEIQRYFQRTAWKFGVYKFTKFKHQLRGAKWCEERGKWDLTIENLETGEIFIDSCDFYANATGILNKWKWPDIEGREKYQGQLVHSANWDPELTLDALKGKNVALIGAGSTGIQILPQIQTVANRVDHYMSGKTWISPVGFGSEELLERGAIGNFAHSEEELRQWKEDPSTYHAWRHKIEKTVNGAALITLFGSAPQQDFQKINHDAMKEKLSKKPEIMEALEPAWPPGCRRLTPGPGYLEALVEDNVEFVPTKIKCFTPEGIYTMDDKERKVDVIICATGFDTSLKQSLPIIGEGGVDLNEVWDPHPESYFGIFVPKMPNMFRFVGPNGAPGTGGFVHLIECACEYMVKVVQKVQREYIKSITVKPEAMAMLSKHIDKFFTKTIYTQPCKSWMKRGKEDGRVITLWPGSAIHAVVAFDNPRWEDFQYNYLPETEENRFSFLGKGLTLAQEANSVTTEYLDLVHKPTVINSQELPRLESPYVPAKERLKGYMSI
ncbi:hypothetical protein N7454_007536 [Penicillium verhagenii]|nr:hypothetical protein N7454_007536 [Penicillium verhagenii]